MRRPVAPGIEQLLRPGFGEFRLIFRQHTLRNERSGRKGAIKDIGLHAVGAMFVQQTQGRLAGIIARRLDLDSVFFLEGLGEGRAKLLKQQRRVPGDLALFFGRLDQGLIRRMCA
jgi:hypothetical protein